MHLWVHECGECGYVAPELGAAAEGAGRIVASAAYRTELKSADRAQLANRMVCRSLLEVAAGEFVTAGWRRLHAAWVCDDANAIEEARVQRRAALELLERARASGQRAIKSVEGGDEVLLADIARRAGEFERALEYCVAGLALPEVPEFVRNILEFECALVRVRDVACHSVGEVEETSQGTVH
jgi:glutathione S-transferase